MSADEFSALVDSLLARASFRPEQLGFTRMGTNYWRKPNRGPDGPPIFALEMEPDPSPRAKPLWALRCDNAICDGCGRSHMGTIFKGTLPDLETALVIFRNLDLPRKRRAILCDTSHAA